MVSGSSTGICALCLIAAAAAEPDASFGSYDGSYGSGSFADAWAGLFNEDGSYSYSSFGSFGSLGPLRSYRSHCARGAVARPRAPALALT